MSIIIIKDSLNEIELFKQSIKSNHKVLVYNDSITTDMIMDNINDMTNLAFVYHF